MAQSDQCGLNGLYEEFPKLRTGEQPPSKGCEEMKGELKIEYLPTDVLAICLSYTGKYLPNARLTCRRFNEIIEEYQYMMNVIVVDTLDIRKDESQDLYIVKQMTYREKSQEVICKLDEVMKYIRFFRPYEFIIGCQDMIDMKKYTTNSWREGITGLELKANLPLLSIFPNVLKLVCGYNLSADSPLLAQISTHPTSLRNLTTSPDGNCEENDLLLDVLLENSHESGSGMDCLSFHSICTMEAIIRFLENAKLCGVFVMAVDVKNYIEFVFDPVVGRKVYAETCGLLKLKNWLHSKGLVQYRDDCNTSYIDNVYYSNKYFMDFHGERYEFVYRSTSKTTLVNLSFGFGKFGYL